MSDYRISKVKEGETYHGRVIHASCCYKHSGFWWCVTCNKSLALQFDKDTHISEGEHKLAWICNKHGNAEVP